MPTARERYIELIALTKEHLAGYSKGQRLAVPAERYHHFVAEARSRGVKYPKQQAAPAVAARPAAPNEEAPPPRKVAAAPVPPPPPPKPAPEPAKAEATTPDPVKAAPAPAKEPPLPKPEKKGIELHELPELKQTLQEELAATVAHVRQQLPQWPLIDTIPDDTAARKVRFQWKTEGVSAPITILGVGTDDSGIEFLNTMAQGISRTLAPTEVVTAAEADAVGGWSKLLQRPGLKLLVATEAALDIAGGAEIGKGIKVVTLPPVSDMQLHPDRKKTVWKEILAAMGKGG